MKKVLFFLFGMSALGIHAQHTLSGTVKDRTDSIAVTYATVALMTADSSIVTGVTTDTAGVFRLSGVRDGDWLVRISFVGYETAYRWVSVPSQSDLGEIRLVESANRLSEVVVTATRPFVEQRVDRYVVNVGSHILTAGRNALDVLRNTPGVLVRPDGGITVMGNVVEIWIDGRPSRLSGAQLNALLTSTQGETIDRIEVITNPSSRYDAAGIGGIINIRTKQGLQYGLNGSVNAGAAKSWVDRENAGLQLNFRNSTVNLFGNYGINRTANRQDIHQTNVAETTEGPVTFDQKTLGKNQTAGIYHQYRLGADFFLSQKSTLGLLVNGYDNGKEKIKVEGNTKITPVYENVDHTTIHNLWTEQTNGLQVNANYQQIFSESGRQLNMDVDYGQFNSKPSQHVTNNYFRTDGNPARDKEQLRHVNPQRIDVYSGKLDYMHPIWENGKLEAGTKSSGSKTDNDLLFEEYTGNRWETDLNQTNRFIYTEQLHAAYLNLSKSWGKWSSQAGIRGEYTVSRGKQRITGAVNDSSYFNIFPTLFINYSPDNHTLGLSYSRRLRRPSYEQLNPFEIKTDAYSYQAGNPHLTPTYIHNIQLSYRYKQSLMARLSYNHITDLIIFTPVTGDRDVRYGMIPVNFGKRQSFSGMVNWRVSPAKWWNVNLMAEGAYATNNSGQAQDEYSNNGFVGYLSLNNSFSLSHGFSAELSGFYVSRQKQGYFVAEPMGSVSAGIRKSLLDNKLMISLNANDLFRTMNEKVTVQYDRVNYKLVSKRDSRSVTLSVRYSFGSQTVKASRNRRSGIEDEAERAR
jgi:outer membrane receptor protein involved in Fe transport